MHKSIKILSLDGGGTRGLFPSTILQCIQEETGKSPVEIFDVIAGSATGGIITAALAAGLPVSDIVDIYLNRASFILPSDFFRKLWNPANLFAPKYNNRNLQTLLTEKLGANRTLKDVYDQYGARPTFILAALDMSPDLQPGEPPEFRVAIYNSCMSPFEKENLVHLAMRNAAAVVNLPLYQRYTEGGNYANDPAMIGLSFALNDKHETYPGESKLPNGKLGLGASLKDVKIFSLGCGLTGSSYIPREKIGNGAWGILKWTRYLVNLVIDTGMIAVQYYLREILDQDQYYRINPFYHAPDAPEVLKNKKLRIDVTNADQLAAIKAYAEKIYSEKRKEIMNFLELHSESTVIKNYPLNTTL